MNFTEWWKFYLSVATKKGRTMSEYSINILRNAAEAAWLKQEMEIESLKKEITEIPYTPNQCNGESLFDIKDKKVIANTACEIHLQNGYVKRLKEGDSFFLKKREIKNEIESKPVG